MSPCLCEQYILQQTAAKSLLHSWGADICNCTGSACALPGLQQSRPCCTRAILRCSSGPASARAAAGNPLLLLAVRLLPCSGTTSSAWQHPYTNCCPSRPEVRPSVDTSAPPQRLHSQTREGGPALFQISCSPAVQAPCSDSQS